MKFLYLIIAFIFSIFCNAQSYLGNPKDTLQLKYLIDSVNKAGNVTYNDCKNTILKAKALAHKSNNVFYAKILVQEGFIYYETSAYEKAATTWDSAGRIYERLNEYKAQIDCLNKSGLSYVFGTKYTLASERLFKGITLAEKTKEIHLLSNLFTNTGLLYESLEDWDNALLFAKKSKPMRVLLKDTAGLGRIYNNIGNLYTYSNQFDSAVSNLRIACALHKHINNTPDLISALLSLGSCFHNFNKPDSALVYIKQAEDLSKKSSDNEVLSNLYGSLSHVYFSLKNIPLAGLYAQKAYAIGKNIEDYSVRQNIFEALYQYNKAVGNTPLALTYFEQLSATKDTLFSHSKNLEFQKTAIQYELGKKVLADSLQAEKKVFVANEKTEQTKNSLLVVALLLLAALTTAIVLYNRSNLLKRKNIIAEQEKQIIEQTKKTLQLKLLQAQMNPHFIFNCFNTIDSFILQNKQFEASVLIQRFSKLTRRILEQTSKDYISLEDEIETINIYLQIEKLRSNHAFNFTIEADATTLGYKIPPMLLQPFVENAVIHGVRGMKETTGQITIHLINNEKSLQITIEDNGIGISTTQAATNNNSGHKSISMLLTIERLKALYLPSTHHNYLTITDSNANKSGTLVTIILPKLNGNT